MERKRIIFVLHCYTDGDWCFRKEPKDPDSDDFLNPCFISDYKNWRVRVDEFGDSYEYCFAFDLLEYEIPYLIQFLKNLKRDLSYSESHDWARREIDNMINPAIEFLKAKNDGTYFETVCDGNWQPTALVINIKTL